MGGGPATGADVGVAAGRVGVAAAGAVVGVAAALVGVAAGAAAEVQAAATRRSPAVNAIHLPFTICSFRRFSTRFHNTFSRRQLSIT